MVGQRHSVLKALAAYVHRLPGDALAPRSAGGAGTAKSEDVSQPRQRQVFGIDASVVRFGGAVYFVPNYAVHRPVARRTLDKTRVSPRLHSLVRAVMAHRPGSMVHAGAFFGDMLPSFSRKTPGLVYAFEPVIESYLLAREVVRANELDNVMLLHAGLGTGPGLARVETHNAKRHFGGAARIIVDPTKKTFRPQTVPMLSIDQFEIKDLSLIQLDVEGFELAILQGSIESIRVRKPVIVIEDDRKKCADLLSEFGYSEVGSLGLDHVYLTEAAADEFGGVPQWHRQTPVGSAADDC